MTVVLNAGSEEIHSPHGIVAVASVGSEFSQDLVVLKVTVIDRTSLNDVGIITVQCCKAVRTLLKTRFNINCQ